MAGLSGGWSIMGGSGIGGKKAPTHSGGITTGGYRAPTAAPPRSTPMPRSSTPAPTIRTPTPPTQTTRTHTPARGGGGNAQAAGQSASQLAKFGSGLLDPGSDLSQRYMEQLGEDIGGQTDAAERAAAYRAAQGGFGAGASPELLSMQQDIGVAGQEAYGDAASNFLMQAPGMGMEALGAGMSGQIGLAGQDVSMRGQDLQSRLAEQGNILSREQSNAALTMQQRGLDLNYDQLADDKYLRELALMYGGMGF